MSDDNALDTLARLFEPMPAGRESMLAVGDLVELTRSYRLWAKIPVGAVGVVKTTGRPSAIKILQ